MSQPMPANLPVPFPRNRPVLTPNRQPRPPHHPVPHAAAYLVPRAAPVRGSAPARSRFRDVRTLGRVTVVLGGVGLVAYLATVVAAWRTYCILRGVDLRGPDVVGQVRAMEASAVVQVLLSVATLLALLSAGVSLLIWIWRVRGNAELIEPGRRFQFSVGFTPWSFLVPVAGLWWSRRVLGEIWAASRPSGRGDGRVDGRGEGQLVRAWWLCQLGSIGLNLLVTIVTSAATPKLDPAAGATALLAQLLLELRDNALTSTIQLGTLVATAVLLGAIVPRISRWQSDSVPAGEL
jgi:hypothetical protein